MRETIDEGVTQRMPVVMTEVQHFLAKGGRLGSVERCLFKSVSAVSIVGEKVYPPEARVSRTSRSTRTSDPAPTPTVSGYLSSRRCALSEHRRMMSNRNLLCRTLEGRRAE